MFCRKCGEEIRDDAVFCPMCGYKIEEISPTDDSHEDERNELVYQADDNSVITNENNIAQEADTIECPPYRQMPPKDVEDNSSKYKFWEGRLNRKGYLGISILLIFLYMVAVAVHRSISEIAGLFVGIVILVLWITASIKRCHDFEQSGYMCIMLFIPIVSFLFSIYLLLKPGTSGRNIYGDEPS